VNLANRITLSRIILVPLFVAALLYFSPERPYLHPTAVLIFLFACLSDALDGWLARRRNELTTLGSYIDPIADKLLLLSGFLSLSWMPHLPEAMRMPAWVTISVISRDFLIVTGSVIVFFTTGSLRPKPNLVGKITTVVQMATLLAALVAAPAPLRLALDGVTVFFAVWSGVLYVRMGGAILQESS
jgi:CDP-diacylglycerol--glycerol-3-phosphate 3-phosphatidyltransferase